MVMTVSAVTARLAAGTLVVGAAVTGCGSDNSSSPSSTSTSSSASTSAASSSSAAPTSSSPAAQPGDYSGLLIKPTDIVVPNDTFTLAQTLPVPNPAGVEGVFMNPGGSRKVDDTIYIYPDAAAAGQALDGMAQTLSDPDLGVKGPLTQVDVGSRGKMAVGPAANGSKAVGTVMFTEGKAFVVLEFNSPPNDPVPADVVLDLARKQDAAIKAGMPS
jgi:hypothetical protein